MYKKELLERIIHDLEEFSKDADINETNIYSQTLDLIKGLMKEITNLKEQIDLLSNSDLEELIKSNQEMEDQLVSWTELIRKKNDKVNLLKDQLTTLEKEKDEYGEKKFLSGWKLGIEEFCERLKGKFNDTEYRANTSRKKISVQELKDQMDWVLHQVVIKNIDDTLKEMLLGKQL